MTAQLVNRTDKHWITCLFVVAQVATTPANATAATPSPGAHCRVFNSSRGFRSVGSGTLIDVVADGQTGLVLTCAHLFSDGVGKISVIFPSGRTHGALLVAIDHQADLAALEIASPPSTPALVSYETPISHELSACGFGSIGQFRCIRGKYAGQAAGPGQYSVKSLGAVRSGDSGGGLFDDRGQLVGVVWGQANGVTYSSAGAPLRRFLGKLLPRQPQLSARGSTNRTASHCPNGLCPAPPYQQPIHVGRSPIDSSPGCPGNGQRSAQGCDCEQPLSELANRLAANSLKQDTANKLLEDRLNSFQTTLDSVRTDRETTSGADQSTANLITCGALFIAIGVCLWLVRARSSREITCCDSGRSKPYRRATSVNSTGCHNPDTQEADAAKDDRTPHARRQEESEATAAAEPTFRKAAAEVDIRQPIERDDREAQQLLRLSQLEGRDPLQDAVAGRLALDRLDEIADRDSDSQHARWADGLRRELRERFNDIAPAKFTLNKEPTPTDSS